METRCQHCGQECWIDDQFAGDEVLCPCCDHGFTATQLEEGFQPLSALVESLLAELPPLGVAVAAADQRAEGAEPKPRRRKPKRRLPKVAVRALLACIAIMAIVGVAIVARGLFESFALSQKGPVVAAGDTPQWRPDPTLLDQLGEPRGVDRFLLRLPKEFTFLTILPDPAWMPHYGGHFTGLMWRGPLGPQAELYCTVVTFSSEDPLTGGLEKGLERFFGWLNHNAAFIRLSHGKGEVGSLSGRYAIRSSFAGRYRLKNPSRVEDREGVVYIMLDENRQISLYTLCSPEARDTHDVMGASLLTWKEN